MIVVEELLNVSLIVNVFVFGPASSFTSATRMFPEVTELVRVAESEETEAEPVYEYWS
jgi:hypothetical protein